MNALLHKFDSAAGITAEATLTRILERLAFVFLFLMLLSAPHSIAATQIAAGIGLACWIARHFFRPLPETKATFLALPILALYGWTVISSVFSYAPDISMAKLRGNVLFFIFFFAFNQLRTRKAIKLAVAALVFSCMVNVIWMPLERFVGKGVKILEVSEASPLYRAGFREGDGLFAVNGKKISSPEDIILEIERAGNGDIRYYRDGHYWQWKVAKSDLLDGKTGLEKLGIGNWTRARSWRSSGFYSHYSTYAEVLQLIGSVVFGLLVASIGLFLFRRKGASFESSQRDDSELIPMRNLGLRWTSIVLSTCLALISLALLLTITRAAQVGFFVSLFAVVLIGGGRKLIVALMVVSVPVVIGGVIFLQQTRGLESVAGTDSSSTWRFNVYREGIDLWTSSARNFTFGVGMDSIKRYADEWHLFKEGGFGHFHSTPIQLLVERGFPALLFWVWLFGAYLWALSRAIRKGEYNDWVEKGILLGAFGGAVGFLVSSLVNYNYGDTEVLMVFYMIMALSMSIVIPTSGNSPPNAPVHPG